MLAFIKKLIYVLALCVFVMFCIQNLDALSTKVFFQADFYTGEEPHKTPDFPVALLLFAFFVIGLLAAGTHSMVDRISYKAELRGQKKRIKELETELAGFRAQEASMELPETTVPPEPEPAPAPSPAPVTSAPVTSRPAPIEEEPTL